MLVEITNTFLQDFLLGQYLASPKNDSPRPFAVPQTVKSSSIKIKQKRQEKRFEITCEKLCAERDAVALDTTQCDRKLLLAIEDVNTLVADTKRVYRDVSQVNSVDHVLCNKHSINFFSAMLHTQEEYVQSGNPGYIDIGYHYTNSENIPSIIRSGLLSKDDRTQEKVLASKNNGAVFGNGVYTGDNPFTFSVYGNT